MNHLESLVAEWYGLQGYFVLRNVKVAPRENGGYDSEIDILAFHAKNGEIIHIETSLDTYSWDTRIERVNKKFNHCREYVEKEFGENALYNLSHKYVFVYGAINDRNKQVEVENAKMILAEDLMKDVLLYIKTNHDEITRTLIPEIYPLLRTIQFTNHYFNVTEK